MAILTDAQRLNLWADLMRDVSAAREGCAITKADLKAAVDAADQWVENNKGELPPGPAARRAGRAHRPPQGPDCFAAVILRRFREGA